MRLDLALRDEGKHRHAHDLSQRLLAAYRAGQDTYEPELGHVVTELVADLEPSATAEVVASRLAYTVNALVEVAFGATSLATAEWMERGGRGEDEYESTLTEVLLAIDRAIEKVRPELNAGHDES